MTVREVEIDWTAYSKDYDSLCNRNDAYADLIAEFKEFCAEAGLPNNPKIADLGAGTGNFLTSIAHQFQSADLIHLDSNRQMNRIALMKYDVFEKKPFVIESEIQRAEIPEASLDLAVCVNALYAMNPQPLVLKKILNWLKPGGYFYVVDIGRKMNAWDWGLHFLKQAAKQRWLLRYISEGYKGREAFKQNLQTTKAQSQGRYWTHNTQEFQEQLGRAGFVIHKIEMCYRGYADLAICRRPHND